MCICFSVRGVCAVSVCADVTAVSMDSLHVLLLAGSNGARALVGYRALIS